MSRNHPNLADDLLLESAKRILSKEQHPFEIQPWRQIMPAANAKEKQKALKIATKNAAAKGILKPRPVDPKDPFGLAAKQGIDKSSKPVVESLVDSDTTTPGATIMTNPTPTLPKAQADKKAQAEKDKQAKAAERAETASKNAAEREAKQKAKAEAAAASGSKRTYFGPMLNLTEKVKAGVYVKGMNGQLRSSDPVALALESCSAGNVVKLLRQVLTPLDAELATKYSAMNIGQQSMNLRNRLRGFIKAEKITLEAVKEARDAGNFADAEQAAAAKAAAKAEREAAAKKAAEAKAAAKPALKVAPAIAAAA